MIICQKEIVLSRKSRGFHIITEEILNQIPEIKNIKREIKRQKIEQVDQEALRQARKRLHAIVAREFNATRKLRTRKKLACFLGKSDPLYRNEEDSDYDEPIEGHIQEACASDAFAGASDFGSRQKSTTADTAGEQEDEEIVQEESNNSKPAEVAADVPPETVITVKPKVFYSKARTLRP